MADDRPVEDPTAQLARITQELDDLRSTVLARLSARPTGDIEQTLRTTPKAGTLLLQGQAVSRVTYVALWQWVQSQGLVGVFFGTGDGSTTFGLPDFRDRVIIGAGTLAAGALVGANTNTITLAQMPSHSHGGTTSDGNHGHTGFTTHDYGHTGHFPGNSVLAPGGTTFGLAAWNSTGNFNTPHDHDMVTNNAGTHSHALGTDGANNSFDNRQASVALNVCIYT